METLKQSFRFYTFIRLKLEIKAKEIPSELVKAFGGSSSSFDMLCAGLVSLRWLKVTRRQGTFLLSTFIFDQRHFGSC